MSTVVPFHNPAHVAAEPRTPPQNVEAEQAVLGAMLLNNAVWHAVGPRLEPQHFFEEIHRRIWEVASALIREGKVATPVTLKTYLGDQDLGGITVPQYLARLLAESTSPVLAPHYAAQIVDLHARRALIAVATEMQEQAYDAPVGMSVASMIEEAETAMMAMRLHGVIDDKGTRVTAGDAAANLLHEVDRIMAGETVPQGVTTGIPDFDRDTGGMNPGDLWIIGGRASMGKTIQATSLARAAARSGVGTLLFPFEIGRRQAAARILSDLAFRRSKPLGYGQILKGEVDRDSRWCLEDARKRLSDMPLVIDDASRGTLVSIAARIRSEKERMIKQGLVLKVVLLDYLKFIHASDRYKGQRVNEVGEITIGLKEIAKDQNVCIVLLAQVNRQTESRDDKRPGLADLRESGDLETDADVVAFVYREHYYIERSAAYIKGEDAAILRANEVKNQLELIVAKNRVGPTRTYQLWCDVACSKISALDLSGV